MPQYSASEMDLKQCNGGLLRCGDALRASEGQRIDELAPCVGRYAEASRKSRKTRPDLKVMVSRSNAVVALKSAHRVPRDWPETRNQPTAHNALHSSPGKHSPSPTTPQHCNAPRGPADVGVTHTPKQDADADKRAAATR